MGGLGRPECATHALREIVRAAAPADRRRLPPAQDRCRRLQRKADPGRSDPGSARFHARHHRNATGPPQGGLTFICKEKTVSNEHAAEKPHPKEVTVTFNVRPKTIAKDWLTFDEAVAYSLVRKCILLNSSH